MKLERDLQEFSITLLTALDFVTVGEFGRICPTYVCSFVSSVNLLPISSRPLGKKYTSLALEVRACEFWQLEYVTRKTTKEDTEVTLNEKHPSGT